jgi:hypothetical protein
MPPPMMMPFPTMPRHAPASPNALSSMSGLPGAGAGGSLFAPGLTGSPHGLLPPGIMSGGLQPQLFSPVTNLRDNPPCNTLFM